MNRCSKCGSHLCACLQNPASVEFICLSCGHSETEVLNGGHRQAPTPAQGSAPQAPGSSNHGAVFTSARQAGKSNTLATLAAACGSSGLTPSQFYQQYLALQMKKLGLPGGYSHFPPEPEPEIEDAGITAGEIVAWRCWRLDYGYLKSAAVDDIWPPGEPMQKHPGKMWQAINGIHAWKTKAKAIQYGLYGLYGGDVFVLGSVLLWGEVIEHERGYLAEYAAVNSIDDVLGSINPSSPKRQTINALRARYGVGGDDSFKAFPAPSKNTDPITGTRSPARLPIWRAAFVVGVTFGFILGLLNALS